MQELLEHAAMFTESDDGCSCYGSISGHSGSYWYLENAYRVGLCEFVPGRELYIVKVPGKLESFCLASLSTPWPHTFEQILFFVLLRNSNWSGRNQSILSLKIPGAAGGSESVFEVSSASVWCWVDMY